MALRTDFKAKIDVHHHVYPPAMTEAIERNGGDPSGWYVPPWTLESDHEIKSLTGTKTAILSVTAPGPSIEPDPAKAIALARQCNDYVAQLRDTDPSGYGFFACLPSLLYTAACLSELAYAFDTLHADGVVLYTRYGADNHYLGHPDFGPIWADLNRRSAIVFTHPTHPVDTNLVNPHLPQPMYDYPHETGRAAMDLILRGTLRAYRRCKIILSHAGGDLPFLIYRAAGMLPVTPMSVGRSTEELVEEAREFYFDTALSSGPTQLSALLQFAKPGRILFGSDFPNAPTEGIGLFTRWLEEGQMGEERRAEIENRAALELFPRLKAYF